MRFVVQLLNFQENRQKQKFTHLVMERVVFHSVAGMEAVMGGAATRIHYYLERLENFDKKYVRKFLVLRAKDLSGMTDLLHHKELHRIYRLHSAPGRKSRMDDCVSNTNSSYSNQSTAYVSRRRASALSLGAKERVLERYADALKFNQPQLYRRHRRDRNQALGNEKGKRRFTLYSQPRSRRTNHAKNENCISDVDESQSVSSRP